MVSENFKTLMRKLIEQSVCPAYYEKAGACKMPYAVFSFNVWLDGDTQQGTLTINLWDNKKSTVAIDSAAKKIINSLNGTNVLDASLMVYFTDGKAQPLEDGDASVTRRLVTINYLLLERGNNHV